MVKDADINAQRKGRSGVRAVGTAGQSGLSWGGHREKANTDEMIAAMPVHASLDGAKQRIIAKPSAVLFPPTLPPELPMT